MVPRLVGAVDGALGPEGKTGFGGTLRGCTAATRTAGWRDAGAGDAAGGGALGVEAAGPQAPGAFAGCCADRKAPTEGKFSELIEGGARGAAAGLRTLPHALASLVPACK